MKKYVQEATDINIWTSIKNNTFERNKDIKEFIDMDVLGNQPVARNAYKQGGQMW